MAALAIMTRTEFLFVLLGGLFVLITLSVVAQVGSFKLTGTAGAADGTAAPPLRDARLARDHDRRAVLADPGPVHRRRPALFYTEWIRG